MAAEHGGNYCDVSCKEDQPAAAGGRVVIPALAGAVVVAGWTGSAPSAVSIGPITVGAVYPLSTGGPPAVQEYHGFLTAVNMVNGQGGIRGRQVRIDLKDVTVNNAAEVFKLARHDHVTAIVGSRAA